MKRLYQGYSAYQRHLLLGKIHHNRKNLVWLSMGWNLCNDRPIRWS
jgi:hypothetical protein